MMTGASQAQQKERERERSWSGKPRQRGPLRFYDKILLIHLTENLEFIGRNWEMFVMF